MNSILSKIVVLTLSLVAAAAARAASTAQLQTATMQKWVDVSEAWRAPLGTSTPFFGANCAGSVLMGLGLITRQQFVDTELMDKLILPECFTEVREPAPGDIAAFQVPSGQSFHFNLVVDSRRSFNKMDIQAKYEMLSPEAAFSCIDGNMQKKKYCRLFRFRVGHECKIPLTIE